MLNVGRVFNLADVFCEIYHLDRNFDLSKLAT